MTPVLETKPGRSTPWQRAVQFCLQLFAGAPKAHGFVDSFTQGEWVAGWAWDPGSPARKLEIAVLDGADYIGSGIADQPRKDLVAAGIGDGRYAFRVRLSARALDGRPREAQVYAVTEHGRVLLRRGVIALNDERSVKAPSTALPGKIGLLERVAGKALHGWAYNPDQPDMPAVLDIYDDERYLGTVTADRSRPRLREKGFPAGVRGFVFELNLPFEPGMASRLRARLSGGSHELRPATNFVEASGVAPKTGEAALEPIPEPVSAPPAAPPTPSSPQISALPAYAVSPSPAPEPKPGLSEIAAEMPASFATVGLAIGAGPPGKLPALATAWGAQNHPHLALAIAAPRQELQVPRLAEILWLDAEAREAWNSFLAGVEFVCFAGTGDVLPPDFAATLLGLRGFPDVIVYEEPGETARLTSFLLHPPIGGFAVRAQLLLRYPGDLPAELAQGFLHGVRSWLASEAGLNWQSLMLPPAKIKADEAQAPIADDVLLRGWYERALAEKNWNIRLPAAGGAPLLWPAHAAASLSIALWRGWERPGLPALAALIAEPFPGGMEILVPTGGQEETGRARLAMAEAMVAGRANITCRLVDADGDDANICAALTCAATGAVLILAEAGVAPAPGTLTEILAWATHPDVGAVGISPVRPDGSVLCGGTVLGKDRRQAFPPPGKATVADAISPRFLVIASRKLVAVGGLDASRFADGFVGLDLGLRLARYGFASLLLGHLEAEAPSDLAADDAGPLPWQVAALLRSG